MKPGRKLTARERAAVSPIKNIPWEADGTKRVPITARHLEMLATGPVEHYFGMKFVSDVPGKSWSKWKRIRQSTPERSRQVSRYNYRLKSWKKQNPFCEAMIKDVCTIHTKDCHHLATRIGEKLLDEDDWLPVCRACHDFIGNNKSWARQNGLLK